MVSSQLMIGLHQSGANVMWPTNKKDVLIFHHVSPSDTATSCNTSCSGSYSVQYNLQHVNVTDVSHRT